MANSKNYKKAKFEDTEYSSKAESNKKIVNLSHASSHVVESIITDDESSGDSDDKYDKITEELKETINSSLKYSFSNKVKF